MDTAPLRYRPARRLAAAVLTAGLVAAAGLVSAAPPPRPDTQAADAALAQLVVDHRLPGASVRVADAEGRVHEHHAGGHDGSERLAIASASKWLSGLVMGRLVQQGVLRWDSRVGEWFPEATGAARDVTLAQLFSHTSGMAPEDAGCLSSRTLTLDECALAILAVPLRAPPGVAFAYGGNSMQVAGAMAERASGRRWDALFLDEVVRPLGLLSTDWTAGAPPNSGYVPNDNPRIGGGARSTRRDYGVVVDMLLAGGLHAGQSYLSAQTIAEMALDRTRGLLIVSSPVDASFGYGIGQWVEARDGHGATVRVSSPGAFGFTPWVDWRLGINGVISTLGDGGAMREDLFAVEDAYLAAMSFRRELHGTTPAPPATVPARPAPRAPRVETMPSAAPSAKAPHGAAAPALAQAQALAHAQAQAQDAVRDRDFAQQH